MSSLGYSDFSSGATNGGGSNSNGGSDGYIASKRKNKTIKAVDNTYGPRPGPEPSDGRLNPNPNPNPNPSPSTSPVGLCHHHHQFQNRVSKYLHRSQMPGRGPGPTRQGGLHRPPHPKGARTSRCSACRSSFQTSTG